MPQPGHRGRTATGPGCSSGRPRADRDLRGGLAASAVRCCRATAGRDVRLYDRATRAALSNALQGRKSEKRETPRTKAATPLRPHRLPMRGVHGLAVSSGTLASTSGCRPRVRQSRTGTTERLRSPVTTAPTVGGGRAWVESWAYPTRPDRNTNESGCFSLCSCYSCNRARDRTGTRRDRLRPSRPR